MLQRLLFTGLLSGAVAGVILTITHLTLVQPLINEAEIFEQRRNSTFLGIQHSHQNNITHTHAGGRVPHFHEKDFHIHADGAVHVHLSL